MIIVGLSDIHGGKNTILGMADILAMADVVVLAGDITHFGKEAQARELLKPLLDHAQKVLAVSGNCDYPEVDICLESTGINLHARASVHQEVCFVGLGGSLITPFHTPKEFTENEIRGFLKNGFSRIPQGLPVVLVSHQPPINTACDRITSGEHVGSHAVREFIEIYRPSVCICGHIHESRNIDKINDTWIINPGMLGKGHYAYVRIEEGEDAVEMRNINMPITFSNLRKGAF